MTSEWHWEQAGNGKDHFKDLVLILWNMISSPPWNLGPKWYGEFCVVDHRKHGLALIGLIAHARIDANCWWHQVGRLGRRWRGGDGLWKQLNSLFWSQCETLCWYNQHALRANCVNIMFHIVTRIYMVIRIPKLNILVLIWNITFVVCITLTCKPGTFSFPVDSYHWWKAYPNSVLIDDSLRFREIGDIGVDIDRLLIGERGGSKLVLLLSSVSSCSIDLVVENTESDIFFWTIWKLANFLN